MKMQRAREKCRYFNVLAPGASAFLWRNWLAYAAAAVSLEHVSAQERYLYE